MHCHICLILHLDLNAPQLDAPLARCSFSLLRLHCSRSRLFSRTVDLARLGWPLLQHHSILMRPSASLRLPIRIPGLPSVSHPPAPYLSLPDSISKVTDFLREGTERGGGGTVCLTGAGVSVDSGIRAYRGKDGSYTM